MPRVLAGGDRVGKYEIVRSISNGGFAVSYEARTGGERVFLKQYKMPTVRTPWYADYKRTQEEIKRRVEATRLRNYCYQFVEFFELTIGAPCYFQVFEFVDRGRNLRDVLEQVRARPGSVSWEQRVVFAKVVMAGIAALHEAKVVHTDLKPENIQLSEARHIEAGYVVKLIDMDFSILADREPPWKDDPAFFAVTSPGYSSPEHLLGHPLEPASDVFTCGLMLYELLSDGHPYPVSDAAYGPLALAEGAPKPVLGGRMPAPAKDGDVAEVLHRCLSVNPARRPTALQVNQVLNGLAAPGAAPVPWSCPKCGVPGVGAVRRCDACGHAEFGVLVLSSPVTGESIRFRIDATVGRSGLAPIVGDDAKYLNSNQFAVKRDAGSGNWLLVAEPGAQNRTLLNGLAVGHAPEPLRPGAKIAIGKDHLARLDVEIEW